MTPLRPARGNQSSFRSHQLVQIIQDRRALDQRLAAIEHKRRHPAQRIIRRDLVRIAKSGPGLMLERQSVKPQRNPDAPDKGGVVLANEDHDIKYTLLRCIKHANCTPSLLIVILRESGVSSTLRHFDSIASLVNTGLPAFGFRG